MYVPVKVGKSDIVHQALIDTGATVNMIRSDVLQTKNETKVDDFAIKGIGSNKVEVEGKATIEFSIGQVEFSDEFIIMKPECMKNAMNLGSSFLLKYGVTLMYPEKIVGQHASGFWEHYCCLLAFAV